MEERGHHLTIFDIHHKKPPSLAQITLELTDMKDKPSDRAKIVDWIADGIKAQNDQWALNIISHLVFC